MKKTREFEPHVIFFASYPMLARDLAVCQSEHFRHFGADRRELRDFIPPSTGAASKIRQKLKLLPSPLKDFLNAFRRRYFQESLLSAPLWKIRIRKDIRKASAWIKMMRFDVVISPEDSPSFSTGIWIRAAHETKVPCAIVPFTVANALEFAEAYYRVPSHQWNRLGNRIVGTHYPKWVLEHRGKKLLRLPAGELLAREWLGLSPKLPWILNSGEIDAIAVESPRMRRYYVQEGLPDEKLHLTGALYDDTLARYQTEAAENRVHLCAEFGFDPTQRLFLCALPPNQFALSGPQTDFADYPELIMAWVKTLRSVPGINVLFKIHPRHSMSELSFLSELGAAISNRDTAELIPLCDVYVASISATIRWAIACGKPVLNYDVYRLRFTDFIEVQGVVTLEDHDAFKKKAIELAGTDGIFEKLRVEQLAVAEDWGILDGNSAKRILGLLGNLREFS